MAKRWWGGRGGSAKRGEVGDGGGLGVVEELLIVCGREDMLVPKEREVVVSEGWGWWWDEVVDDVIEEDGDAAGLDGIVRGPDDGKVAGDGSGRGGLWNREGEWGGSVIQRWRVEAKIMMANEPIIEGQGVVRVVGGECGTW